MQDSLNQVLQRLQAATDSVRRLQQREQEQKKIHNDLLIASEKQHVTQWEDFMKEQHSKQAEVDEEHRKAVEKLREQYTEMEKGLARFSTFWEREPQQWRTNEKKLTFPPQKKTSHQTI